MAQTSDEIRQRIEETRRKLGADLNELETRVRGVADLKTRFRQNPSMLLGLAFGGGLLLGLIPEKKVGS